MLLQGTEATPTHLLLDCVSLQQCSTDQVLGEGEPLFCLAKDSVTIPKNVCPNGIKYGDQYVIIQYIIRYCPLKCLTFHLGRGILV